MSIKDYYKKYVVINGLTNEQIVVPKTNVSETIFKDYQIDDVLLFTIVMEELEQSDSVTIFKSFMKDQK